MNPWFVFVTMFAALMSIGNGIRRRRRERPIRELVEVLRKQAVLRSTGEPGS